MTLDLEPGVHRIDEADYHADPCKTPSASSSLLKIISSQSPQHAWMAHPRLNPDYEEQREGKFDVGSAAHALILGDVARIEVVNEDSWRKAVAKDAKERIYASGGIPLLTKQFDEASEMAEAVPAQLLQHELGNFLAGTEPQVSIIWEEDPGLLCRCLLDWHHQSPETALIWGDLKTTTDTANPAGVYRRLAGTGADMQAAWYLRALTAAYGPNPDRRFVFLMVETTPPYALSVVEFSSTAMHIANRKLDLALRLWQKCLKADQWPGYTRRVVELEPPPWEISAMEEREEQRNADRKDGIDEMRDRMLAWQAPQDLSGAV